MRPFGVGFGLAIGPIAVDKIRARGRELGLRRVGLETFVAVMRELDAFSAKWQAEEHRRRSDAG